jgi:hypothetical protein
MHTQRKEHSAAVLSKGSTVLVAGGDTCCSDATPTRSSAEIFDLTTQTFTATGSMSQARYGFGLSLLGDGSVLASGGAIYRQSAKLASAERYYPNAATQPPPPQTVQIVISSSLSLKAGFTVIGANCQAGGYTAPAGLTWNVGASCTVSVRVSGQLHL